MIIHTPMIVASVGISWKNASPITTDSKNSTYLNGAIEEISTLSKAFSIQYSNRFAPTPSNMNNKESILFTGCQESHAGMTVNINVATAV